MDKTKLTPGTQLIPANGPTDSAIQVVTTDDNGVEFERLNPYWNGEHFRLRWEQLDKSHWIIK